MLNGKTAIVTGSTSGISLGIAEAFARAGANVVLNGFGEALQIEKTRSELAQRTNAMVVYSPADMSKPKAIEGMIRQTVDMFGSVDIMVNNAGVQHVAPIDEFPEGKWDAILAINLSSAFHATKAGGQDDREGEIGIRRGIRCAVLHPRRLASPGLHGWNSDE